MHDPLHHWINIEAAYQSLLQTFTTDFSHQTKAAAMSFLRTLQLNIALRVRVGHRAAFPGDFLKIAALQIVQLLWRYWTSTSTSSSDYNMKIPLFFCVLDHVLSHYLQHLFPHQDTCRHRGMYTFSQRQKTRLENTGLTIRSASSHSSLALQNLATCTMVFEKYWWTSGSDCDRRPC